MGEIGSTPFLHGRKRCQVQQFERENQAVDPLRRQHGGGEGDEAE